MTPGKIYLLRGGLVLRYQGRWGGPGPSLAFRSPSEGVMEPAVGYSASPSDVLRELGGDDRAWLEDRRDALMARGLDAEAKEIVLVLQELAA